MNNLDIDILDLSIINEFASETQDFIFENKHRAWDGFVYFTDGAGIFTDSCGKVFEIKKSSLVLLRAAESYSFRVKSGYRYITSAYKIADCENSSGLLPKVIQCSEREDLILENIYKTWQQRKLYSKLNCKIQILTLYLELFKTYCLDTGGDINVNRAKEFISTNFKRSFSSSEISEYCGISASHLRAKFHRVTGMTLTEYRENLRIEEAKKMLSHLSLAPKEAAYELGYSDVYHFTKVFKDATGITPAKYAKENR